MTKSALNQFQNKYTMDGGLYTHPEKGTKHRVSASQYDKDYGGYYHTVYHQNGKTPIGAVEHDRLLAHRIGEADPEHPLWMAHRAEGPKKSFTKYMGHHSTVDDAIKAVIDNKQKVHEGRNLDEGNDRGEAPGGRYTTRQPSQKDCDHSESFPKTVFTRGGRLSKTIQVCANCGKHLKEETSMDDKLFAELLESVRQGGSLLREGRGKGSVRQARKRLDALDDLAGQPTHDDIKAVVADAKRRKEEATPLHVDQHIHNHAGFEYYHIPKGEVGKTHHWLVTGGHDYEGTSHHHTITGTHEDVRKHLRKISSEPYSPTGQPGLHGYTAGYDNYSAHILKPHGETETRYHKRGRNP